MESNECVCFNAWKAIESLLNSIIQMNSSLSNTLQVTSTDSGYTYNANSSSPNFGNFNNNFIIFLAMLGLFSYLMNRMPRLRRPENTSVSA